jgi:hypothetical protein
VGRRKRATALLGAETREIVRGVDRDRKNPIDARDIDARDLRPSGQRYRRHGDG